MSKVKKREHSKKKMYIPIASAFFVLIIIIIFAKNNYKFSKNGNNISNQNNDKICENILNISSYKATLEVTIKSNKNTNKYILKQTHNLNEETQEVLEPESVKGTKTTYNSGKITIQSSKLNITKSYKDGKNLENNDLWLSTFIKEYKNSKKEVIDENKEKIIKIKNEKRQKELYIDKKTQKPTKLIIYNNNQKEEINIIYNEIEINT